MRKHTYGQGLLKWLALLAFDLLGLVIVWAAKTVARLSWWTGKQLVRHPRTSLAVGAVSGVVYLLGWETVVGMVGMVLLTGSIWKAADRDSFTKFVGDWLTVWWRRWWVYRRMWDRVMVRCGLAVDEGDTRHIPTLIGYEPGRYWDRLEIGMEVGQEIADWRTASEKLRHGFRALRSTVREVEPAGVEVALMKRDPFRAEKIAATAMPARTEDIDWTALPVGMTEYCEPWVLSVVGAQLAIAGTSGAGKSSIPWSILRAVAPAIADGTVRLHFCDPKRMELRRGRALVATHIPIDKSGVVLEERESYVCDEISTLNMLKGLVADMEAAAELAGDRGEADHEPSRDTPLNIIIIDELAPLLEYWTRSIRDKIMEALGLLLTQGRAVGYIVVGSIQEPTKDVFKCRDLFGRRLCLRVPTEAHTDAALTEHAVDYGALSHEIPEDLPGVTFDLVQGSKVARRNRAGHVTGDDIAALVEYVEQLRLVASVQAEDAATATVKESTDA